MLSDPTRAHVENGEDELWFPVLEEAAKLADAPPFLVRGRDNNQCSARWGPKRPPPAAAGSPHRHALD